MLKKGALFILMILTSTVLCSCFIPMWHKYDDISANDIVSIEVYDLRESDNVYSGFYKKTTPVYALNSDDISAFLDELSDISFTDGILIFPPAAQDPSFEYGDWVIRINYSNGEFTFVSCYGFGETFNADGEDIASNHYGCDDEEWYELISKYVPEEVFNAPTNKISDTD